MQYLEAFVLIEEFADFHQVHSHQEREKLEDDMVRTIDELFCFLRLGRLKGKFRILDEFQTRIEHMFLCDHEKVSLMLDCVFVVNRSEEF